MKYVDLGSGLYVVIGGSFPLCNTIVLLSDEISIVDPGCRLDDLTSFLRSMGHELQEIDFLVLSHIHPDHITHAARIQRLSKCKVVANEITAPLFDDKEKMKSFLGFYPGQKVRPFWEDLVNEKMYGALDDAHVDVVVGDRESLELGDFIVRTIYTPGHLPDHMCLDFPELGYLFGADLDCTDFGPFYGHPKSSISQFRDSIELVREMDLRGLISGHLEEPLVESYRSALKSYSLQIDIREDFVLMAVTGGAGTIDEITMNPIIYKSLSNLVFLQFEKWMIEHHIESLLERELVKEVNERFVPA
jgi:glyoxylase-like metal-dependent hydrolase (beta-lactamase superfamily II)